MKLRVSGMYYIRFVYIFRKTQFYFVSTPRMKRILFLLIHVVLPVLVFAQEKLQQSLLDSISATTNQGRKSEFYLQLHNLVFKTDLVGAKNFAMKVVEHGKLAGSPVEMRAGYLALARCFRKERDYLKVFEYDSAAIEQSVLLKSDIGKMLDYLTLARDFLDAEKIQQALTPLNICLKLIPAHPDSSYCARFWQTYGWYFYKSQQHEESGKMYKQALEYYLALKNEQMIAETQYLQVLNLLDARQPEKVPYILFGAIDIYTKRNSLGRLGECYGLLGQAYLLSGNSEKGIQSYKKCIEISLSSQNLVDVALARIDLARCYLLKQAYKEADLQFLKAEEIFRSHHYEPGKVILKIFKAQYYSAINENVKADQLFSEANQLALAQNLKNLIDDNNRYWAQHKYQNRENRIADSLLINYSKAVSANGRADILLKELEIIKTRNSELDTNSLNLLKQLLLNKPIKGSRLEKKSDSQIVAFLKTLLNISPYSLADSVYEQKVIQTDNAKLLELETKYLTRLKDDSLRIEKQKNVIEKQISNRKSLFLMGALIIGSLLAIGMYLQFKSRKRAVQDRDTILELKEAVHHDVKNNIAVMRRFVEKGLKDNGDKSEKQILQTRLGTLELLHKHLYLGDSKGNIPMQTYFTEQAALIKDLMETDKNVEILVDTEFTLSPKPAEYLVTIVNELLTNSFKHAFLNTDNPCIRIVGEKIGNKCKLTVSDNGSGIAVNHNKNYGSTLIRGFTGKLKGNFSFDANSGTTFTITFTDNKK